MATDIMPLYSFKSQLEFYVNMLAIHITQTNIGLRGPISRTTNQWELEIARSEAARLWPDIPVHTLIPSSEGGKETELLLPKWRLMGLLEGQQQTELGIAFSYLVIIYFQDDPYPFVSLDIELSLHTLNWDHLANHRGTETY